MTNGGPGGADAGDEASTPWERPRRWAQDRPGSPSVDDLLARFSAGEDASGNSVNTRRRRRDTDAAQGTGSVAAGDLIAAFGGTGGDGPAPEPPHDAEQAVESGQPTEPDRRTEAAPSAEAEPSADASPEPGTSTPDPTEPTARAADPESTDVLPVTVGAAPAPEPGASWESVLESLQRQAGTSAAYAETVGMPAAGVQGPPPRSGSHPAGHGDHPHHRWLVAGRSVVALFAVLLLVAAGWDWVSKVRAQSVLTDNNVSAVVTDDTNISTPSAAPTSGAPGIPVRGDAPEKTYQAENILLMGSDTRSTAEDAKLGGSGTTTMQSDVLMIAHLSADRSHVTVVSIPRDLYVPAPTCKAWDYQTNSLSDKDYPNQYRTWKITNAYSVGGPQCTVRAVQKLTGLRIDRVIIIDFAGFKTMVDALGGITVNACRPVIDTNPGVGTVLPHAGSQHIDGAQALKLVRARHVIGDSGSDLSRIHRQQMVLSILLRKATSTGVLLNPARLDSLLQAFVHSVHTDNVTLDDLLNIAQSLGNLDPSRVTFYTLPTQADGEGLSMTPQGPRIWNALVNDRPLPGEHTDKPVPITASTGATASSPGSSGATSSSTTTASPTPVTSTITRLVTSTPSAPQQVSVAPKDVKLQVVNVAGRGGVATVAMNALNPLGFDISDSDLLLIPGDVRSDVTVEFSAANRPAAVTVAAAVPGATLVPTDGLGNTVRLMLGSSFDGTVRSVAVGDPVPAAASTTPSPVVSTVVRTTTITPPASGDAAGTTAPTTAATATPATQTTQSTQTTQTTQATQATLAGVSSVNAAQADCF